MRGFAAFAACAQSSLHGGGGPSQRDRAEWPAAGLVGIRCRARRASQLAAQLLHMQAISCRPQDWWLLLLPPPPLLRSACSEFLARTSRGSCIFHSSPLACAVQNHQQYIFERDFSEVCTIFFCFRAFQFRY